MAEEPVPQATLNLIRDFTETADKVKQGIRIFNELYSRRASCYTLIAGKKPSIFKRMLWRTSAYDTGDPMEGLRIVNDRERRVVSIIEGAADRMAGPLKALDIKWKKEQAHLFVLERYLTDVLAKQKEFLNQEYLFLEYVRSSPQWKTQEKSHLNNLQERAKGYFDLLDTTSTLIVREYRNFYSPKEFQTLLKKYERENPVLAHLNMMGGLAIFVGLFVGFDAFANSVPESLFNVNKLPSAQVFVELYIIAYFLTITNLPERMWSTVKKSSRDIVVMLALVSR